MNQLVKLFCEEVSVSQKDFRRSSEEVTQPVDYMRRSRARLVTEHRQASHVKKTTPVASVMDFSPLAAIQNDGAKADTAVLNQVPSHQMKLHRLSSL